MADARSQQSLDSHLCAYLELTDREELGEEDTLASTRKFNNPACL